MAKIMLVEDDNNLRQIYEDRLAAEGYEIVSAPDGEAALALAVKERPDLIIADVMMPKVSGFDMLDILRSTPETKDCKIIMMTALSQAEDKERAEKLGADRYLVKSQVTLEDVAKIAGEILGSDSGIPTAATPGVAPTTPAPTSAAIPVSAPPTTPVPTQAPDPAPEPTPAEAPTSAPVPEPTTPSVTSIPVSSATDDEATSLKADEAALAAAALAMPASEEKSAADQKVDEFIASNPTLSDSADAAKPNTTTESEVAIPAPEPTPTPVPDPTPIKITIEEPPATEEPAVPAVAVVEAPAPAPAPEPTTPPEETPNQKVADAVDGLLKATEGTTPEEDLPKANFVSESNSDPQSMTHTKRIEPISSPAGTQAPDIHELLAREGEVGTVQPPVNSVITPGNGGSINAEPVDNMPQVNVLAEQKPEESSNQEPPATGTTIAPAQNSDITL